MMPFLTSYDPPGSSEGTLDPLGLYQIADQLAVRLVPAIRERMQRVRFLTAMAIGAVVTEELDANSDHPDAPPFLVWEWLVVEALIRSMNDEGELWGVPGTLVTRNALGQHGYLDLRSYLKTPRIFGFHGVYKRLTNHLGVLDVHLGSRPETERLVDAWARSSGLGGLEGCRPLLDKWRSAVQRSLNQSPPRTRNGWTKEDWHELADTLAPHRTGRREKKYLSALLHADDDRSLKALSAIWRLQTEFANDTYNEEALHQRLAEELPSCASLLSAIRAYEQFARVMQDAFDLIRAEAAHLDAQGFEIPTIADDGEFAVCQHGLNYRYQEAQLRLSEVDSQLASLFDQRFSRFADPQQSADFALALCEHHETIQKAKSDSGKRAWFDRLSPRKIYMRHQYRVERRAIQLERYLHDYRGQPIRNFYFDLA